MDPIINTQVSKNKIAISRIVSIEQLRQYKSVYVPYWKRNGPVAVFMSMQTRVTLGFIHRGLYITKNISN